MISAPKISKRHCLDYSLLIPYLILCIIGLVMVYSSSSYHLLDSGLSTSSKAIKQLLSFLVSLTALGIVYRLNLAIFRKQATLQIILIVTLLLLVAVAFVGQRIGGAKRWIDLGLFPFQPSELVPLTLVLYLSSVFSKKDERATFSFKAYKTPISVSLFFIFMVTIQPNVAGGSMIFILVLVLLLASGLAPIFTGLALFGFIAARKLLGWLIFSIPTNWMPAKFSYLASRFEVMKDPFIDPVGKGFQTTNAYYAIDNGGFFGLGLGNSIQKKGFLPAADTDFIFAICLEELGLIGSLGILLLVFFLVARMYQLAVKSKNLYYSYLYIGCATILCLQVSVNVGSLLGYIPMTGVTFPFISYGGSSLLILSLILGLVLNVRGTEIREEWAERKALDGKEK